MLKHKMKNKSAFTLIEILIAIAVFSIGILTVLRLITWNMAAIDKVKIKTQATILAKEWIELVYNLRDSNYEKEQDWNCIFSQQMYYKNIDDKFDENEICNWYFWSGNENQILQISFDPKIYLYSNLKEFGSWFEENFENNKLYYQIWEIWAIFTPAWNYKTSDWYNLFWYDHDTNWQESNYARYIVLTGVTASWQVLDKNKILKIESHVLYKKWNYAWEVILESFIGDY